jgi:hypothetical protein
MIVTTHFESLNGSPISGHHLSLLNEWKKSWEMRGFTCIITDEKIYANVSDDVFKRFYTRVESFPSVNHPGFDRSSFMRWYAAYLVSMQVGEPICVSECDVINYSLIPADLAHLDSNKFNMADKDGCPAFVYTNSAQLRLLVDKISAHELTSRDNHEGRGHISDQNYIAYYFTKESCYNSIPDIIGSVLFGDWNDRKLVHYGTPFFAMKGYNTSTPKAQYINQLKPVI